MNPTFGWGDSRVIETGQVAVFAHRCEWEGTVVVAVHNLSSEPVDLELDLGDEAAHLYDLLGERAGRPEASNDGSMRLDGYGYRWFRVGSARDYPHHR